MKKEEKEYIEPEIINESNEKAHKFENKKFDDINNQVSSIKKAILLKGLSSLILPISIFLIIIIAIVSLIMYVIDTHPFDYIVSGIFLFLILSPVYKLIKYFK